MTKMLLFGEPLIRITPLEFQKIGNQVASKMYYGGSEVNIACNLQGFGISTKLLTGLPTNPVGDRFLAFLKENDIDVENICRVGKRIGVYYLENGFGCRQSEVFYDRENTSISDIFPEMLDMDRLFHGVKHFHFSGITIAVGKHVRELLHILLTEAKKRNVTISLDLNLRTKMISVPDAKRTFSEFARYADYCFGIDPIMADENDWSMFDRYHAKTDDIRNRMECLKKGYSFKGIFHTLRMTDENGNNIYQAYALAQDFQKSIQLKTRVLERVGSGDAFIAGALYKLINDAPLKEVLDFAVASGTMKCTIDGDNMSQSAQSIENMIQTSQDIIR